MRDKVWVGTINHKNGTNFYAARTREGMLKQLARYCWEWWREEPTLNGIEMPDDDEARIDTYFEYVESEHAEYGEVVLD